MSGSEDKQSGDCDVAHSYKPLQSSMSDPPDNETARRVSDLLTRFAQAKGRKEYEESEAVGKQIVAMGVIPVLETGGEMTWHWRREKPKKIGKIHKRHRQETVAAAILSALETPAFRELRMEARLTYSTTDYDFAAAIRAGLDLRPDFDLSTLHLTLLQPDEGRETSTRVAKRRVTSPFENKGPGRPAINMLYDRFVREVIGPHVARVMASDFIVYGQCCFRIQPPSPVAIGVPHCGQCGCPTRA